MKLNAVNNVRPGLWGFFVCLLIVCALYAARIIWTGDIAKHWPEVRAEREKTIQDVCRADFDSRARTLLGHAVAVTEDSSLFVNLFQTDPEYVELAFQELHSLRHSENLTYEITDAEGSILCWAGKSVDSTYEDELENAKGDTIVSLAERGLYTYLTVGIPAARKRAYVFISHPLVVNYPISTRFLRSTNFTDNLRALVKTDFRLVANVQEAPAAAEHQTVVLNDFRGNPIGTIVLAAPQEDAVVQEVNFKFDRWLGVCIGLATLCAAWVALVMSRRISRRWLQVVAVLATLWTVRFIWIAAEFPSRLAGGWFFDPSVYSSVFIFGIAGSVGETLLSVLFLSVSILVCIRPVFEFTRRRDDDTQRSIPSGPLVQSVVAAVILVVVLLVTRGFGAVIRSFVVDSTIGFHDPVTTFPSAAAFLMQVNILILSITFVLLVLLLFMLASLVFESIGRKNKLAGIILPPVLFSLTFLGFQWFNSDPIVPWYLSLVLFLGGFAVGERFRALSFTDLRARLFSWKGAVVLIACASLFALVVTDREIHSKEREQVRAYARRLVQPLDSWISFVLNDGLRSVVSAYQSQWQAGNLPTGQNGNLAFLFWTKTLMSQEGYNSAVVVYNDRSQEISRFSVGLSTYEQREILTKAFDNEEETVVTQDHTSPLGPSKSYAIWSTIRSDEGKLLGSVALVLSATEKSMFGGEESETLLANTGKELQNVYRPIAVTIFENGRLAATTHEELSPEQTVPQTVLANLKNRPDGILWMNETIGGRDYESLFAQSASDRSKIVEVSMQAIDYRWHIFDFLKLLSAAFVALIILALVRALRSVILQRRIVFTFRTKLLVSFLILGFVPLILLSYYNRQFAEQSLDEAVKKTLSRDLDIVSQRIVSSASDEEDYFKGINNDFAESVSSDVGIDFTVYHRMEVQASSRPELYQASMLDARLPGTVFAQIVLLGRQFVLDAETIGSVRYAVGYKPLYLHGNFVGVLAVPAPYHQRDIEEDLAQRNAYYAAVYTIMILIIMVTGWGIAQQLSIPVQELTAAAKEIGKGNLDVHVSPRSKDEIGELVQSFDQMAVEIKTSRFNLAAAERKLAWTEMAKQVAHEIKNPLTPMKLSIQHLRQAFKDRAKELPSIVESTTNIIVEQIDALSRIAAEFSQYARMPEKHFERISLDETILECVELFKNIKGIEFRVKFNDLDAHIIADKDELRRVFINIIRNSVQAMERGGTIAIESENMSGVCTIRFTDSGEGIPEAILSKVFEPNFSTKTDGTGLGLAISQKVIQELNGTIGISSVRGKGTTVEIRLPV